MASSGTVSCLTYDFLIWSWTLTTWIKERESKGDQLRQGDKVVIVRAGSSHCPVAMLEMYLKKAGISLGSDGYLFWGIISGKVQPLRSTRNLSYTRFSELLKQKLKELGLPPVEFSPHSLWSGGATAAAGAGIPDRILSIMGTGNLKMQRMGMLKIHWKAVYQSPRT